MSQLPINISMDIEDKILKLKEIINNQEYIENGLEKIKDFLSDISLRTIPVHTLNDRIFDTIFSYAQDNICNVLKNISENLENTKDLDSPDYRNHFDTLVNLLNCWNFSISHVSVLEKISITNIKCLSSSIFEIMIEILCFCKTGGRKYEGKSTVTKFLASIFRHCIDTLNSFYVLLDSVIFFDVEEKEEKEILLKIIDNSGKLATLIIDTDSKSLMDIWKQFCKLSTGYSLDLKSISSHTITFHFKGLAKSIVSILSYVDQISYSERPIFCSRVLIKILETLCDAFCGWISNDVMNEIIITVSNLCMYNEQSLKINGYNSEFIKFVTSNFTIIIEPLLDVLLKNENFKMVLFNYGKNVTANAIGYHLLLLTILRKISTLPYVEQRKWCNKEESILDACFQNINRIREDILMGKMRIQISRDIVQRSQLVSIYEATCLWIFAIVCQISNSDFSQLILLLLKYLLNGDFFSSLLSSDIWCFICRLGSSEMCYTHFKYLIQIYGMLKERKYNFNIVILYNLIGRQYNLLLDVDKTNFIDNLNETSDFHVWSPIVQMMNTKEKMYFTEKMDFGCFNNRILADLKNIEQEPSLNNLSIIMKNLKIIETSDEVQNEQLESIFNKLWNKILYILSDCEGTVLNILEDFAISILRAIHPESEQKKFIISILEVMVLMYPYASTSFRLEFCQSFCRFAEYFSETHKNVVADLMYRMLSDDDPCIQQQVFESFEHMTLVCQSVEILSSVAVMVKNGRTDLSKILFEFIGGEEHDVNLDEFFVNLCNCVVKAKDHACSKKAQMNWEKIPKLSEPTSPTDSDNDHIEEQAHKICVDIEQIMDLRNRLKKDTYDRLRRLCGKFLDQNDQESKEYGSIQEDL